MGTVEFGMHVTCTHTVCTHRTTEARNASRRELTGLGSILATRFQKLSVHSLVLLKRNVFYVNNR